MVHEPEPSLPASPEAAFPPVPRTGSSPAIQVAKTNGSAKAAVLVVDDEPMVVRALSRWLRAAGYDVETALDGESGANLVAQRDFDVIVTDVSMPGMSGVELLRIVRSHDPDVPVILVTGNPALETAVPALEYGALRYLCKPIDPRELEKTVARAAQLHQMAKLRRQALALLGNDVTRQAGAALQESFGRALSSLWAAYQPIVRWSDRSVFGFEALLRSEEPSLPHPGAVLDAAEQLGRLPELGRAIRAQVAEQGRDAPAPNLFVNLHTRDLLDETLYAEDSPLSRVASRVVLEITERASLEEVKDVGLRVAALRAMGYRIAIDDLGAGFAGLTSFAELEPEVVKLDMSLIRNVHKEPTKRKLVGSITALCKDMDLAVVAEGVETIQERDTLVQLGCDLFQGYLFAKPGRPFPTVAW